MRDPGEISLVLLPGMDGTGLWIERQKSLKNLLPRVCILRQDAVPGPSNLTLPGIGAAMLVVHRRRRCRAGATD